MSEKKREPRKTLWQNGKKGASDWMRVLHDAKEGRVEVKYKDAHGITRREIFPDDKKGKASAIAWAEAYRDERKRLGAARTDTTHAELWAAYVESPAWANLRDTSKPSYTDRWAKWQNFRGAATRPNETTLHHIDRYIMSARKNMAINQIRQVLNVARIVYNWGFTRKLLTENAFTGWRWKTPKDVTVNEPGEYNADEYERLLRELSPQDGRRWRAHVALMIAGHHGGRANAVLNLEWSVIDGDEIVWPPSFQKNGKELRQPLTWDLVAALETARYWRRALGYEGRWILFAGGGNKKIGRAVSQRQNRRRRQHGTQVITVVRKERTPEQDTPYTYGGLWEALRSAEQRAGVTHEKYRAMHGFRRHAAGNVADATGDATLAMRWIGDDIRQAPRYLKQRDAQMERAAEAASTNPKTPEEKSRTVPEVSQTQTAPQGAVVTDDQPST